MLQGVRELSGTDGNMCHRVCLNYQVQRATCAAGCARISGILFILLTKLWFGMDE